MNHEKLEQMLGNGYNCAQTVFCYFADRYGLDHEKAKRTVHALESGMLQAKTCGAVSAAYLVLGLEYSSDDPEARHLLMEKVQEFNGEFEKKQKTTTCHELLQLDITTAEGLQKAIDEKLLESVCAVCIFTAIEILEKMIHQVTES